MLRSAGLYSYIQNNNIKSALLLIGFLGVVQLMFAAVMCWLMVYMGGQQTFPEFLTRFTNAVASAFFPVLIGSLVWVGIAFLQFKKIMRHAVGLHATERRLEPRIYNIVENLSISVGLPTPKIEISESPALNAFAMGLSPTSSTIGVTRGLLNSLDDHELEAVIAHELTHIRAHDVRLLTLATIFCGIIFSFGWYSTYRFREMFRYFKQNGLKISMVLRLAPLLIIILPLIVLLSGQFQPYAIALSFVFIFLALMGGLGLRLAISRTREFVADAGAVELTKNPEALISALLKIEGRSLIDNGDVMLRSMMISAPSSGLSATHPAIEDRIDAIVIYAAQTLRGLTLKSASQRFIPHTDENGSVAGFSIKKMKYPAWISKPIIVVPSLVAGGLTYLISQNMLMNVVLSTPQWFVDFWNAPASGKLSGFEQHQPNSGNVGHSIFSDFGLGDLKITIIMMLIGLPIVFAMRYLVKSGYIKDDDDARRLMGKPSKLMQSDWDDETPLQNIRVNVSEKNAQFGSSQLGQRPMFGASAAAQFDLVEYEKANDRTVLGQSQQQNISGLKAITSLIPTRFMYLGMAIPMVAFVQLFGLMPHGGGFSDIAPVHSAFNVRPEVQTFFLSKIKTQRQEISDAIQKAAYKCAFDLSPSTPAGSKFGAHWAKIYGGVAYISTFGETHFPTNEEVEATFMQHTGKGNPVSPEDASRIEGSSEFYQNYWDKGLVNTDVRNECVFEGAFAIMSGSNALKPTL